MRGDSARVIYIVRGMKTNFVSRYGIEGATLHKHYNRDESHVLSGYVEVDASDYACFSRAWIAEAARVLRPGGSFFVVSGYTHLLEVLEALEENSLLPIRHLIWKYVILCKNNAPWVREI